MGKAGEENEYTKWLVCLVGICVFAWYLAANIFRILTGQLYGFLVSQIYTTIFALPLASWVYLLFSEHQLHVHRSILSFYAACIIIIFGALAVFLIVTEPLYQVFMTGLFDHTFFPIAFSLLLLCDLREIDWRFWAPFLPFGVFNFMPNINVISQLLFDVTIFSFGCPGLFDFFGSTITSKAELLAVFITMYPQSLESLGYYLREQFTFFTLFPFTICYYLIKAVRRRHASSAEENNGLGGGEE